MCIKKLLPSVLIILCTAAPGLAADVDIDTSADPVVGTWTLNVAKSTFTPGPAPKEQTRVYEAKEGGIKVTVKTVAGDGHSTSVLISANYDGKDYPVIGSSDYDAIELKQITTRVAEATLMHAGTVVATSRREVSDDGRTMTIIYTTSGGRINNKAVYVKQE
jgi:hypothetical protein